MTKKEWFILSISGNITQENINEWISEGNSIHFFFELEQISPGNLGSTVIFGPNIHIFEKMNALMIFCIRNFYNTSKLLLGNGANPYLLNNRDKSAYDYANDDIKKLILEYHPYYLHKCLKKYMIKGNNKILNIKKLNLPLTKLI